VVEVMGSSGSGGEGLWRDGEKQGDTRIVIQTCDRGELLWDFYIVSPWGWRITRGTIWISQSKVPLPGADETAFLIGDVRYGEAFPTVTCLDAGRDRENIAKTFAMPHEVLPKDNERRREGFAQEDAPNTDGIDQGEDLLVGDTMKDSDKSAGKGSDSTDEMANVLGTLRAANILASGGLRPVFTTASLSVVTASTGVSPAVATANGSFPTAVIFTTASVATPTTTVTRSSRGAFIGSSSLISNNIPSISKKDKRKGKMTEPKQPSKEKVLEQISVQLARDLKAKFAQEDQIIREQAERDFDIARIHAERELEMMIIELDMSNKMVAKYLSKYEQAEAGLSHDEKVELIDELLINAGWKAKDFKGMTFKQIEKKFIPMWEKMQDFVPMNSKLESKRLKRPGIQLDKESFKKLKTAKALGTEPSQEQQFEEPKELSEEELKKMIEKYWKIIRVENHTEVYQIFKDMLKKFDRKDLDKHWILVKETCSTTKVTDEKAKEIWVELKRLYEPDSKYPLWALQRYMHDPLVWRIYDTCGVHHVSTGRGHQIFMLMEKDYPLTKGLTTLMLSNKLQVDQYSEMANELLMKIYIIANSPR
nr:hypothetical protein [Tanacetum cinerariifolium]